MEVNDWMLLKDFANPNKYPNKNYRLGHFVQQNGRLYIFQADYRVHGAYNCYPQANKRAGEVFYLVILVFAFSNSLLGLNIFTDPFNGRCDPLKNLLINVVLRVPCNGLRLLSRVRRPLSV